MNHISGYLALPNYVANLKRLGWSEADLAGDGSDRLVDAVIAIGDVEAIIGRARQHLEAGADHVCIQLRGESAADPALAGLADLAAAAREL